MTDKTIALKFGKILREQRKKAGLTQEKLAKLTGLTPEHIQRLEGKNPSGIRLESVIRISRALKLNPSIFLRGLQ